MRGVLLSVFERVIVLQIGGNPGRAKSKTACGIGVDLVWWTGAEWGKGRRATMPKSHARYAPEYRRRMGELVRAGRSPDDLAKEFEPTAQSIRNWVVQAARDEGSRS